MKKIMFNDKYGLTAAVLEGRKTMTRRVVKGLQNGVIDVRICEGVCECLYEGASRWVISLVQPKYQVGEIVAIAQAYKEVFPNADFEMVGDEFMTESKGWNNKMFVRSELMKHHIRITDIKVEKLQDISDEDCLKEGILKWKDMKDCPTNASEFERNLYGYYGSWDSAVTPRKAFEYMIDRISGDGTWNSNPFVFVYTFKLID